MSSRPAHEQFIEIMTDSHPNLEAADRLLLSSIHSSDQMVRMAAVDYWSAEKHVEHLRSKKMRAGLRDELISSTIDHPRERWIEAMSAYDGYRAAQARYHSMLGEQQKD